MKAEIELLRTLAEYCPIVPDSFFMILQICNEFVLQFYIENKIVFGKIYE